MTYREIIAVCSEIHKISEQDDTFCVYTVMRRLTMAIRSQKSAVRRFRRCANVIECTYTNLDSTV
jgi:hypothetical protein